MPVLARLAERMAFNYVVISLSPSHSNFTNN